MCIEAFCLEHLDCTGQRELTSGSAQDVPALAVLIVKFRIPRVLRSDIPTASAILDDSAKPGDALGDQFGRGVGEVQAHAASTGVGDLAIGPWHDES